MLDLGELGATDVVVNASKWRSNVRFLPVRSWRNLFTDITSREKNNFGRSTPYENKNKSFIDTITAQPTAELPYILIQSKM